MNDSENEDSFILQRNHRNYNQSSPQGPDKKELVLKLCTVIVLIIMIILIVDLFFENRQLQQNQVQLEAKIKRVNDSAIFFKRDFSSFEKTALKYTEEQEKELANLTQSFSELHSKTFESFDALQVPNTEDILQKLEQIEDSQQKRKVQLDMVNSNLKQLYRNQRIQLFQKLGNTTAFQPVKIRSPWNLTRLNFQTPYMDTVQKKMLKLFIKNQTQRLQKDHEIHVVFNETPICVIAPTLNNAQNYRYQYSLQSILNQNYTNYKLIIIDQGSKDMTVELIRKYMKQNGRTQKQYTLLQRSDDSPMEVLVKTIKERCLPEDIVVIIHGSDELTGTKVFKLLNKQIGGNHNLAVLSNFFRGFPKSHNYTPQKVQVSKEYRTEDRRFGHFVTFKADLFHRIKQKDLKFQNGTWFDQRYDEGYLIPILQMACGRTRYLDEYLYLVNHDNDQHPQQQANSTTLQRIRSLTPYQCLKLS